MRFRLVVIGLVVTLPGRALLAQQSAEPAGHPVERASLGLDAGYTSFSDSTDSWRLAAVSLQRKQATGTLIGRVTVAERYGTSGAQYEVDAYPRLGASTYAYVNAGHSPASIFPEWRFGGELFTTLPNAYEASLGFRHLRFTGEPVTLFTGSLGRYTGNYWFSLRPYVRSLNGSLSTSAGLTGRRYFDTADEYLGARVGYGSTPSDRLVATELLRQHSLSADVHGSRRVTRTLVGTWLIGVEHESLDAARTRNRVELDGGVRVDF